MKSTYRLKIKLITWCLNTLWCTTTAVNNQYKHINSMFFWIKRGHYQLPLQLPHQVAQIIQQLTCQQAQNLLNKFSTVTNTRFSVAICPRKCLFTIYAIKACPMKWEKNFFFKLSCICTSFFHTNWQTVTVKLCLYFLYVPIAKIRTLPFYLCNVFLRYYLCNILVCFVHPTLKGKAMSPKH